MSPPDPQLSDRPIETTISGAFVQKAFSNVSVAKCSGHWSQYWRFRYHLLAYLWNGVHPPDLG